MIEKLIRENRSVRQFDENKKIDKDVLLYLVNLARLSASAANLQPLKYIVSSHAETNEKIFECLGWAAYLKEWKGPEKGKRPTSYIIILNDTKISNNWIHYDCGISAQSILLGAREKGIAGCMIGSIDKKKLSKALSLENHLEILLIIALGIPAEQVILEDISQNESIKYYRDEKGAHHVPKRKLNDIIIKKYE
jgi:nitroreductase